MKGSSLGEKFSPSRPSSAKLTKQITHFYQALLVENAEDYYNFSETAYKNGSECPYLWRVVSWAHDPKCPRKIPRSEHSADDFAVYV